MNKPSSLTLPEKIFLIALFLIPFDNFTVDVGLLLSPTMAVLIVCTLYSLNRLNAGQLYKNLNRNQANYYLMLFLGIVVISSFIGQFKLTKLTGNIYLQSGMLRTPDYRWLAMLFKLCLLYLIYFIIVSFNYREDFLIAIFNTILLSCLLASLFGVYQFLGSFFGWPFLLFTRDPTGGTTNEALSYFMGIPRINSFSSEPKGLANFLWSSLIVSIVTINNKAVLWNKSWLRITILSLSVSILFLTFARSGWVFFILSLPIILFFKMRFLKRNIKASYIILAIFFMVIIIAFIGYYIKEDLGLSLLTSRFESFEEIESEDYIPRINLEYALEILPDHLLSGIGWGNFCFYLLDRFRSYHQIYGLHNMYLNVFLEVGIFGLLSLLLFIILSLKAAYSVLGMLKYHINVIAMSIMLMWALTFSLSCIYSSGPDLSFFLFFGMLNGASLRFQRQFCNGRASQPQEEVDHRILDLRLPHRSRLSNLAKIGRKNGKPSC